MRLPISLFRRKRYLAFKRNSQYLKHNYKKRVVSLIRNILVTLNPERVVSLNRNQVVSLNRNLHYEREFLRNPESGPLTTDAMFGEIDSLEFFVPFRLRYYPDAAIRFSNAA